VGLSRWKWHTQQGRLVGGCDQREHREPLEWVHRCVEAGYRRTWTPIPRRKGRQTSQREAAL